jgi:hypothetical protein
MLNETELIGNEIIPIRGRRMKWKDLASGILFGVLYIGLLYGFILIAAADCAQK